MDRPGSGIGRLIGLLLALNLGVLVVGLGFMYWPVKPSAMPEFNGDKVTFLSTPGVADSTERQVSAPVGPPTAQPAQTVQTESAVSPPACLSWTGLDADRLSAVEAHLDQLGIPAGSYDLRLDKRLGWWVYLPPFGDPEALRVAMEDARQRGVTDIAQVRGGKMANAVSLGAFPTLVNARAHAGALAAKGLRGVKVGPRPESGELRLLFSKKVAERSAAAMASDWPQGLRPGVCAVERAGG